MNSTVHIKGLSELDSLKRRKDLISKVKTYWAESCESSGESSKIAIYPEQDSEETVFVKLVSLTDIPSDCGGGEAKFKEIASKISEAYLTHHVRPLRKKRSVSLKGYLRGLNSTVSSLSLWPSSTVDSYLATAAHNRTAEDALAKDWQNVGDDVWFGVVEALHNDFEGK